MTPVQQHLFDLLPAIYKIKDAQIAQSMNTAQGPLQSILMVVDEQLAIMADNLDQFYDDLFIETCAPWVIPYIGDLIGYQTVTGVASAGVSQRAEVARTVSYRQRKGTVLVLEQLARDVTGWGAHAVEFFKLLATSQYMNHIRLDNHYAPDLRSWQPLAYMDTGFDRTAHNVDVRRIAVERGRYNIQNVGIFLWSLTAYPVTNSPVSEAGNGKRCYRFSLLGRDAPLFNNPVSQGATITAAAQPVNVPDRLLREVLEHDLRRKTPQYYGPGLSLALYLKGALVHPSKIHVCDLSGADGSWINVPTSKSHHLAAIDPVLGRIAMRPPKKPVHEITATYYYGFNANMGGGEYERASTFAASAQQAVVRVPGDCATVHEALDQLPGDGVVEITDNGLYQEPAGLTVAVNQGALIELRAADGCRPTLALGAPITVTSDKDSGFYMNGLVVMYDPEFGGPTPPALVYVPGETGNELRNLGITHCTLVPGWSLRPSGHPRHGFAKLPTVLVDAAGVNLAIQYSIVGGMWVNAQATTELSNSVVDATHSTEVAYFGGWDITDAPQPGGALTAQGCTIVGKTYATVLTLISNSICLAALSKKDLSESPRLWASPLWADRQQSGCVRYSYLPASPVIPQQYKCVTQAANQPEPVFYSLRYGDPSYCKLVPDTSDTIRRGADDGGEMGAFHFLLAPLRETDLQVKMLEYLPVGLEYGVFYET